MSKLKTWLGEKYIAWICKISPTCHEMTRRISAQQDHALPWPMRLRMRLHYGICVWCERYREQLALLRKVSRAFPEAAAEHLPERLPEDAKARLKRALGGSTKAG